MNTTYFAVQACEIIFTFVVFRTDVSHLPLFSVMVVRCGSHPSVTQPCFVFPFANRLPLGRGRRVGMVESSLRSDQWGWRHVGAGTWFSFRTNYTYNGTFGTQRCSSPCLRYLCNTSIGRELFSTTVSIGISTLVQL